MNDLREYKDSDLLAMLEQCRLLDCIGAAIHHNRNPAHFYLSYGVG